MRVENAVSAVAVTLVLGCSGAEAPVEYPDAVTADPDHYTVEHENDAVRVLRITYGPGETSAMHRHPANCAIFLDDQPGTMESPDGEVTQTTGEERGTVTCSDAASVHLPSNTGEAALELVLVEFKDGGMAGSDEMPDAPHAVMADPDHYSIEFENDVVRLVRVRYGPGETSVMHHHPAYCAVNIEDQPMTFQLPDGSVEEPGGEPDALNCVDADMHSPTNTGDGDLDAVLIEFKARATAG